MPNQNSPSDGTTSTPISEATEFRSPVVYDDTLPLDEIHFLQGGKVVAIIKNGKIIVPPVAVVSPMTPY
mgnify:FL=1